MRHTKKQNPKATNEPQNYSVKPTRCNCGAAKTNKPKLPAHLRRLKIQPKYIFSFRASKTVPFLVLQGEWLRNMGFECEHYVIVDTKLGELVIKVVQE